MASAANDTPCFEAATSVSLLYGRHRGLVLDCLRQLGVHERDRDDLCQEVFIVVSDRAEHIDRIDRVDLWLREICRRVAAGYRRRAFRTREILTPSEVLAEAPDRAAAGAPAAGEVEHAREVRCALGRLDDEGRDMLALHDAGEMPLSALAELVEHDRKTVRKRLDGARRRLSALLRDTDDYRTPPPLPARLVFAERMVQAARAGELSRGRHLCDRLQVAAVTPGLRLGLLGNTVIGVWQGATTLASIETLMHLAPWFVERSAGKLAYLSIVESVIRPPPLDARQKIVEALDGIGPFVLGYATVLAGGGSWIARPIMSGLTLLARPRFPMSFFSDVTQAAAWLCHHWGRLRDTTLPAAELAIAADVMRRLRV